MGTAFVPRYVRRWPVEYVRTCRYDVHPRTRVQEPIRYAAQSFELGGLRNYAKRASIQDGCDA